VYSLVTISSLVMQFRLLTFSTKLHGILLVFD
jgi:hypothetical protein